MTLPRLYAFADYWKAAPPVAESVAAFLGIKPAVKAMDNSHALREFVGRIPTRRVELPK